MKFDNKLVTATILKNILKWLIIVINVLLGIVI